MVERDEQDLDLCSAFKASPTLDTSTIPVLTD
jgi:hypothetical protein